MFYLIYVVITKNRKEILVTAKVVSDPICDSIYIEDKQEFTCTKIDAAIDSDYLQQMKRVRFPSNTQSPDSVYYDAQNGIYHNLIKQEADRPIVRNSTVYLDIKRKNGLDVEILDDSMEYYMPEILLGFLVIVLAVIVINLILARYVPGYAAVMGIFGMSKSVAKSFGGH
jgi:hypothetical protein